MFFLLPFAMLFLGGVQFVQRSLHGAAQIVLHANFSLTDGVLYALGLGGAVSLDDRLLCSQEGCAAVLLAVHLVLEVRHLSLIHILAAARKVSPAASMTFLP